MLKKIIIILFLTVLAVRPAYFVGNVVYYETHLSEIVEKYCVNKDKPEMHCNGQCHLSKELSGVTNSTNSKALANMSVAFFPVFFQEFSSVDMMILQNHYRSSYIDLPFTYYFLKSEKDLRPPIV